MKNGWMMRFLRKKGEKKPVIPKSVKDLRLESVHRYMMHDMSHSVFLRKAPKHYRFVRNKDVSK